MTSTYLASSVVVTGHIASTARGLSIRGPGLTWLTNGLRVFADGFESSSCRERPVDQSDFSRRSEGVIRVLAIGFGGPARVVKFTAFGSLIRD